MTCWIGIKRRNADLQLNIFVILFLCLLGDGFHDNRQFGYHGQQYGHQDRNYSQQDYAGYQSWGNQGGPRFHYNNQRQRGQGHYPGYGSYGYHSQDAGQHYMDPGAQYHRNSPVMILQRDQRHSGFQKHKK